MTDLMDLIEKSMYDIRKIVFETFNMIHNFNIDEIKNIIIMKEHDRKHVIASIHIGNEETATHHWL